MLTKGFQQIALSVSFASGLVAATAWAAGPEDQHPFDIEAPPLADRVHGLSTIWSEAKFSFAYFDQVPDLDWDEAYRASIPRVVAAETLYEYYRELQAFVALLEDGHTNVRMPSAIKTDVVPLTLEPIEDRYFVANAATMLADEVPIGSEIVSVRGIDTQEYVQTEVQPYIAQSAPHTRAYWSGILLLRAPVGEEVAFEIMTPAGERREIIAPTGHFYSRHEYVPPHPKHELGLTWPAEGIAKVIVPTFYGNSLPADFAELIPELEHADAIILDFRFNGGGVTSNAHALLRHLTDRPLQGPRWVTREHRAAHRVWGAHGTAHLAQYGQLDAWTEPESMQEVRIARAGALAGKPIAVLTSSHTASTAEDFLIYADPLENVTRIGRPTCGSTGQPFSFD
ncbi:MAG: S41 family peptidase, partial [Planctomycetota bacterium]